MEDGNVDTWHDHMYESYTLIAKKLLNVYLLFTNFNLIACYNYNVTLQKIKCS
jgi:hypothetical protein